MEEYADQLDATGKDYLQRLRAASQRMALLIDDLLGLARVSRAEMKRAPVDLSALARSVATELRTRDPQRQVELTIPNGLQAVGDAGLLHAVLTNLLGNAWKFTSKTAQARIEVGRVVGPLPSAGVIPTAAPGDAADKGPAFFVRDNGAGFDMAYAAKLFGAFQRLHDATEFEGTGIGLATVARIIHRHGGRVWAEGAVNQGATVYFTL